VGINEVQAEYVEYGDEVYLQGNFMNHRWLSGVRGKGGQPAGNEVVLTRNLQDELDMAKTYQWIIQSVPEGNDYKRGTCLKYGDIIFLYNVWMADRWLSGARNTGNKDVITQNHLVNDHERLTMATAYQWIVRSNPGTGSRSNDLSPDPAYGECVEVLGVIYLQVNFMDNRWLSGARNTNNKDVITQNHLVNDHERITAASTYQWIVRKLSGDGGRVDARHCAAVSANGYWFPFKYSNAQESEIQISEGVIRTFTESASRTKSWERSVTASISSDFSFGDASLEVSTTYGESMTSSVESAISKSKLTTHTSTFGPGQMWQFVYDVRDICVSWELKTKDLVITYSKEHEPCCLPGLAQDIHNQHGPCRGTSPCQCSDDVCKPKGLKACADLDFDGGFGSCETYVNHCARDTDLITGTKAEDACSECGMCT